MTNGGVSAAELAKVRNSIAKQELLVDRLTPGTEAHRVAVELLLVFRDSLFVLQELKNLLQDPAHAAKDRW